MTTTAELPVTNADLEVLLGHNTGNAVASAIELLQPHLKINMSPQETKMLERDLTRLKGNFYARFVKCSKQKKAFRQRFETWLQRPVRIPQVCIRNQVIDVVQPAVPPPAPAIPIPAIVDQDPGVIQRIRTGRRPKPYPLKSKSAKVKFIKKVAMTYSEEVLRRAFILKLKMENRRTEAEIVEILGKDPTEATRIKRQIGLGKNTELMSSFSAEEGLELLLKMGFTKAKYMLLRERLISKGFKTVLPPYYLVREAKQLGQPEPIGSIQVTYSSTQVPFQNLLEKPREPKKPLDKRPQIVEVDATKLGSEDFGTPAKQSRSETKKDDVKASSDNLVSITQLREQIANLQQQLSEKEKDRQKPENPIPLCQT